MRLALLALLAHASLVAQPPPAQHPAAHPDSALDKPTLEAYVRRLFLWGPQIQVKVGDAAPSELPGFFDITVTAAAGGAVQEETFLVSKDGRKVVRGTVYDITGDPFAADRSKLRLDGAPSLGPAGGALQLVMFSDFQCSFCRQGAKVLKEHVLTEFGKDLQVFYKDYPLEAIHPWAKAAAVAGRCVYRQQPAKFWGYHDWIFETQDQIKPETLRAQVTEFAKGHGLAVPTFEACLDDKSVAAEVDRSAAEARALSLNSTPTLFLNGRKLVGAIPWEQMKEILTQELAWRAMQGKAK